MAQARGRYLGMDLELISPNEAAGRLPAARPAVLRRRAVRPGRGPRRPVRRHPRLCQVRPARSAPRSTSSTPVVGLDAATRRHLGRRSTSGERSTPSTSSTPAGCGRARSAGWSASSCRCWRWSTCTCSPRTCRRSPPTSPGPATRCRWRSTSPARSTSARRAAACCSAPTSRPACRGRRDETPWDFGPQLLKPDLDRIAPELEVGFRHFPAMGTIGIKQVVNGPFTFSPDGNPLVGPVRGLRGFWVACGVMAGLRRAAASAWRWRTGWSPATRRLRHGYLGDGRRPLRRLGDARLHERQGAGELPPPVPDHVPERGAAGRAGRCRRRRSTTGSTERTPSGARRSASSTRCGSRRQGSTRVEDVTFRRSNAWRQVAEEVARRPRAGRPDRDLQLRQVPGHRARAPRPGCRRC